MDKIIKYSDYLVDSLNKLLGKEFLIIGDTTFLSNDFQRFKGLIKENNKIPNDLKEEIDKIDFTREKLEKEYFKESVKIAIIREIPLLNAIFASKIRYYEDNFVRRKFDEIRAKMNKINFVLKDFN